MAGPQRLDLATLYTSKGLFSGTAKMPIPSTLDSHLYVPAGPVGTAMANLAARMGLETTGIALPIASPAEGVASRSVRMHGVVAGDSRLAQEAGRKLHAEDASKLNPGEGELHIVDDSFGRRSAVLASGDDTGSATALDLLSGHFPNLWDTGKQHLSIEEIRYDLHRFFSLRSGVGQAAMALHHLGRWSKEVGPNAKNVKAEVYVDLSDSGLAASVHNELHVQTVTGSLHAGTQCCDQNPALHYEAPGYRLKQAAPTFTADIVIPWEGRRLIDAVREAVPKLKGAKDVRRVARLSEGPEGRRKLETQLRDMLARAGVQHARVVVLCA